MQAPYMLGTESQNHAVPAVSEVTVSFAERFAAAIGAGSTTISNAHDALST